MKPANSKYIWFDGRFLTEGRASVPLTTHAIHYGTSAFEGIRAYWNGDNLYIFRLDDHTRRLLRSCEYYSVSLGFSNTEIKDAIIGLCRKNKMRKSCYIRPFAFVGDYGINLHVTSKAPTHLAIFMFPFGDLFCKEGISAGVSSWRKFSNASTPVQAKMGGNYLNSIISTQEARSNGFDEAILLDVNGDVSEAPGENIFIVRDDTLVTPPTSSSALKGITRDSVLRFAGKIGCKTAVKRFRRRDLYGASEVFLTGTAAEITPVTSIDERTIGDGSVGRITRKVMDTYQSIVMNKDPRYARWLTGAYT